MFLRRACSKIATFSNLPTWGGCHADSAVKLNVLKHLSVQFEKMWKYQLTNFLGIFAHINDEMSHTGIKS